LLEPRAERFAPGLGDAVDLLVGAPALLDVPHGRVAARHEAWEHRVDVALRRRPDVSDAALGLLLQVVAGTLARRKQSEHRKPGREKAGGRVLGAGHSEDRTL